MDDGETELSRFLQQWQAEVTARAHPPAPAPAPATATSSSSSTTHHQPKPSPFAPRRLSNRGPVPDESSDEDEGGDAEGPPDTGEGKHKQKQKQKQKQQQQRERSISPVATRKSVPGSALEHYERAVEKESQGSLGESLSLYRKAFRIDAKVDSHYREKYYPRPSATTAASTAGTSSIPHPPAAAAAAAQKAPPASIAALIESFSGLAIPPAETEDTEVYSPLAALPHELLLHIMRALAITDIASFVRSAKVCKALSFVVATEESIWRDVCIQAFAKMAWDWRISVDGTPLVHRTLGDISPDPDPPAAAAAVKEVVEVEEEEEKRIVPNDEAHLPAYRTWRAMFQSRPRVRFNGIYISTCNYVRQGASQSGWNTPVHIVTYYRYLRFHDDGTVLSLQTTSEPSEVVHGFSRAGAQGGGAAAAAMGTGAGGVLPTALAKYVARGRWRIDPEGRVDVETMQRGMDKYLFRMQLRLASVRSGGRLVGGRKLLWESYWSWNRVSDDIADFSLRNDKPFIFSRVGNIERELGLA